MSIDLTILNSKIPLELYFSDNVFQRIRPLDALITSIIIKKTQAPPHKYAFDYQSHLSYQGIQYQRWVQKIIQFNSVNDYDGLGIIGYKLRSNLLEIIQTNYNSEIGSILSALLIGYRNDIDPELQKQFANSGAMSHTCPCCLWTACWYNSFPSEATTLLATRSRSLCFGRIHNNCGWTNFPCLINWIVYTYNHSYGNFLFYF